MKGAASEGSGLSQLLAVVIVLIALWAMTGCGNGINSETEAKALIRNYHFKVPFVMMVSIPLSLIGILVGHWIMGAFFTATSMIGMVALAGIMVRNAILLIDFVNLRLDEGIPLKEAIVEAGAVRTTPILLTAGTVVIGAVFILFDPIFQGLAISLMGGTIASTFLTLIIALIILCILASSL